MANKASKQSNGAWLIRLRLKVNKVQASSNHVGAIFVEASGNDLGWLTFESTKPLPQVGDELEVHVYWSE